MRNRKILISNADHGRLAAMIESVRYHPGPHDEGLDALERELERARVVSPSDMLADVVTMNSVVRLRDLDSVQAQTGPCDGAFHCLFGVPSVGSRKLQHLVSYLADFSGVAGHCG